MPETLQIHKREKMVTIYLLFSRSKLFQKRYISKRTFVNRSWKLRFFNLPPKIKNSKRKIRVTRHHLCNKKILKKYIKN